MTLILQKCYIYERQNKYIKKHITTFSDTYSIYHIKINVNSLFKIKLNAYILNAYIL